MVLTISLARNVPGFEGAFRKAETVIVTSHQ
jgi:hypothetical protein